MELLDGNLELKEIQKLQGHTDRVWSLAWNPATAAADVPKVFASCSGDKTVRIWEESPPTRSWDCKVYSIFLVFVFAEKECKEKVK